jgi:hypothetical protein
VTKGVLKVDVYVGGILISIAYIFWFGIGFKSMVSPVPPSNTLRIPASVKLCTDRFVPRHVTSNSLLSTAGAVTHVLASRRKQREPRYIQEPSPRLVELCVCEASRSGSSCSMGAFTDLGVTSEVFVIVSLTLFLPICLEQFARDNGYYEPDHITRCAAAVLTAEKARCVVKIGWVWIDTASFRCAYQCSTLLRAY